MPSHIQYVGRCSEHGEWNSIKFYSCPDCGNKPIKEEMTASATGALRSNKGKLPIHWVPFIMLEAFVTVLWKNSKSGGGKYPDRNWEKGANYSTPMDSLLRHSFKRISGETHDPDDGLPHTWKILTNAVFLVFYEKNFPELDDLKKEGK